VCLRWGWLNQSAKPVSDLLELFIDVIGELAELIVDVVWLAGCRERPISRKLFALRPRKNQKARTWRDWIRVNRKTRTWRQCIIGAWDWIGLALLVAIVESYLWS
jgi:hypothetical protein